MTTLPTLPTYQKHLSYAINEARKNRSCWVSEGKVTRLLGDIPSQFTLEINTTKAAIKRGLKKNIIQEFTVDQWYAVILDNVSGKRHSVTFQMNPTREDQIKKNLDETRFNMVMSQLRENGWDSAPRKTVTSNDVTNPLSWGWDTKNSVLRMIKNHLFKEFQKNYTKHSDITLWLKNQLLHEKRCTHNMFGGEWDSQLLACYTELSTTLDHVQIGNNTYNYRNPSPYAATNIQDIVLSQIRQ